LKHIYDNVSERSSKSLLFTAAAYCWESSSTTKHNLFIRHCWIKK